MLFTDILIKKGVVTQDVINEVSRIAHDTGKSVESLLVARGVSSKDLIQIKAEALGIPYKTIGANKVSFDVLKYIPSETAMYYKVVPVGLNGKVLEVGMVNPEDIAAKEALQFLLSNLGISYEFFLISQEDFNKVLGEYEGLSGEATQVLGELESELTEKIKGSDLEQALNNASAGETLSEDAPVTKMVAVILRHAISGRASDIHIEPSRDRLQVRFRVDGVLYTSLILPLKVHDSVISRIKILCNMKLDEKRKPQDGRFSARIDGREVDFRVSSLPTFFGEKMAIRILDTESGVKTLGELGFSEENIAKIRSAIKAPYGMILLTGPTGSGKSTTLYAMLQELDRTKNNIISLEDPVEYTVSGVNQSQVKPEIGYDFASGLRSILRQDPDMIMVGEIRDKETASLAIQAALTGHLVFSTLHTNTAAGVIPRLIDMGIDPYLLAPTIILSIGQRLVSKLCPDSKDEVPVTGSVKERLDKELAKIPDNLKAKFVVPSVVYQPKISGTCPKGISGRTVVSEALPITKEIRDVIYKNPTETSVTAAAREQGLTTWAEDTLLKIFSGEVGIDSLGGV